MTSLLITAVLAATPDYALLHIIHNSSKVESFSGTLVQGGLVESADVKAQVAWSKPSAFAARILEPAAWAGISVTYENRTLQSYYPMLRWAIRLRGLDMPSSAKDVEQLVTYQYDVNQRTYDYRIDGVSTVAGLSALTMFHTARSRDTVDAHGWTKVYDPFSFALAGELHFPKTTYTYRWDAITFNQTVPKETFSQALPEGTLVTDWDLAGPVTAEAAMRQEASFPIVLPDDNGVGLKRTGIVRAAGPIPAFAVRYQRGPHFLVMTVSASAGASVPAYGIPLELGHTTGRLILGPATSTYAFVKSGTYYTLLGNIPSEELVKIAAQLSATKAL
jgi:hypothetical protein